MTRIRFDTTRFGETAFTIMFVELRNGTDLAFGVSPRANRSEIVGYLRDKGVEVTEKQEQESQHLEHAVV